MKCKLNTFPPKILEHKQVTKEINRPNVLTKHMIQANRTSEDSDMNQAQQFITHNSLGVSDSRLAATVLTDLFARYNVN